jgi:hypothetical protein
MMRRIEGRRTSIMNRQNRVFWGMIILSLFLSGITLEASWVKSQGMISDVFQDEGLPLFCRHEKNFLQVLTDRP